MNFYGLWQRLDEGRDVLTAQATTAIVQTFQHVVPGQWRVLWQNKRLPTWRMRSYYNLGMQGSDVVKPGDAFEVFVHVYVYKRPRAEFEGMDIHARAAWVDDPSQWHDSETYDARQGSPLVRFCVSINGRRADKAPEDVESPYPAQGGLEQVADTWESKTELRTPYEVAAFVRKSIEDYYRRWDGDGDDEESPQDPSPASPVLVGAGA